MRSRMPLPVHFIDDARALDECAGLLRDSRRLAVDTESNSMHAYAEQVCFLQINCGRAIHLIDTIRLRDLAVLAGIFADPEITKVFHGADYDVVCLRRDFGFEIRGLRDTMLAAQFLDKKSLGLAALSELYFGVRMDKSLTKHDWGRRPLEDRYFTYLADDVRHLPDLDERLAEEIRAADVEEELQLEFLRVSRLEWSRPDFDPEGWRRIKGAREVEPEARPFLKALFVVREEIAREENVPPYKILHNDAILAMCRNRALQSGDFGSVRGIRPALQRRWGARIRDILAEARSGRLTVDPERRPARRFDPVAQALEEDIRRWRKNEAATRGVPNVVVLPNHVLERIVEQRPQRLEDLEALEYLGKRRLERYGEALLGLVARRPAAD